MRVKICGITQANQGRAIAQLGATALGFISADRSPRYVEPSKIREIVEALAADDITSQPTVDRVGVFVDASVQQILEVVVQGHLSGVQLHGRESVTFCQMLRTALRSHQESISSEASHVASDSPIEIVKAFRVRSPDMLEEIHAYRDVVDTFLLDAYHPTMVGGTGKTLNWKALKSFSPDRPWLLAGGLNPDNVLEALSQLQPDGIDLSSGVERSPGDKDLTQVKRLFEQLQHM